MTVLTLCALALAEATHVEGSLTVQVFDREAATRQVVADTRAVAGWFSALDDDGVTVKVPRDAARSLVEKERRLGRVVGRTWDSRSLDAQRTELVARITTREQVLAELMKVLDGADADSVTAVRHEISRIITEIESYEGQLRRVDHDATYATLRFSWQFRDRGAPKRDGASSFAWLNTMNLGDLQDAFRYGRLDHRTGGVGVVVPDGFAAYRRRGHFAAASPEGLVYRVRTAKNKPKADLAFWREALRTRLTEAGYTLVGEGELTGGLGGGAWIELAAANGPRDDTYLVAVYVDGGVLVIAEAAGDVARFAPRKEAVLAAMRRIGT